MSVRLDSLLPGDRFEWNSCEFELVSLEHISREEGPHLDVRYLGAVGSYVQPGDLGLIPVGEMVDPLAEEEPEPCCECFGRRPGTDTEHLPHPPYERERKCGCPCHPENQTRGGW